VRQKTFTFLYDKFTPDNMYQILSQSVRSYRIYVKKHFRVFFRFTVQTVLSDSMPLIVVDLLVVTSVVSVSKLLYVEL